MGYAFLWYFIISLIGLLSLPITFIVFRPLSDRGYGFVRTLGLLLWGLIFWLLSSFGILKNNIGGLTTALLIIISFSIWALIKNADEIIIWLKENKSIILITELVFLLSFFGFVFWRGLNPQIFGTEKPMELAFINSVIRSEKMPPADPWLSGYAISYYYFGYVLVGMLAKISNVTGGIAFNLGLSLIFALSATGAYSIVYNLLSSINPKKKKSNLFGGFLGSFFLLFISNAEGFLEILHARQLFWQRSVDGVWSSKFWTWLSLPDLISPPTNPDPMWTPRMFQSGWWWWRASRVVQDTDFSGAPREIIDEFPVFSFRLGDMHPHVLAIPFVLLAIALAFSVLLRNGKTVFGLHTNNKLTLIAENFYWILTPLEFISATVFFGALMFLNFWDLPVYLGVFCLAAMLRRVREEDWEWKRVWETGFLGISIIISAYIMYLPYHLGFASQAGGIIPNLIYITRGIHFWIMFLPLLIPIIIFSIWLLKKYRNKKTDWNPLFYVSIFFLFLLVFIIILSALIVSLLPNIPSFSQAGAAFMSSMGATEDYQALVMEGLNRRITQPGTWITLLIIITISVSILWRINIKDGFNSNNNKIENLKSKSIPLAFQFSIILILFGALMVLAPEFIYLRDFFGYRINTIFKFYYQTWILWSIAAAFATAILIRSLKNWKNTVVSAILFLSILIGLCYTTFAIADVFPSDWNSLKTNWRIEGAYPSVYLNDDETQATNWLWTAPRGVIAEAVGGSYSQFARVSSLSGQISVLGWEFHENQWRGSFEPQGSRKTDIQSLYETQSWEQAQEILLRYQIDYIFIGTMENSAYRINLTKFDLNMNLVFESGDVCIYQVR